MLKRCEIENVLNSLDAPQGMMGYSYTVDILYLISTNDYWVDHDFSEAYVLVGRKYHKSGEAIYNGIRRMFEKIRSNPCDFDLVEKYLGFANCENSSTLLRLQKNISSESEKNDSRREYLKQLIYEVLSESGFVS